MAALAFAPYLIGIGMQVFFANKLSVEDVGVFAATSIFLGILLSLSNWNGDKYIISKKNISQEQVDAVFTFEISSSLVLYLITVIFFRDAVNNYLKIPNPNLFWIAMCFICCYHPLIRGKAILEKQLSYISAYSPILFANIIAGTIGSICIFQGLGLWSMLIWKVSTYLIEVIILLYTVPYIPRLRVSFSQTAGLLSYSLPIFLGTIFGFISLNVDKILVTNFMGERELGIYWLAFTLSHTPLILRELLSRLMLPILSKQSSKESKLLIYDKLNGVIQILGVLSAIFVTYWSDTLFQLVFGEKWLEAVPIFIVLFYAAIFKLIGGSPAPLLLSAMRTKHAFYVPIINILIFVPIMFVAIKFGGLSGSAMGVLISVLLLTIIVFETFVRKFTNMGFLYYFSYISVNILSLHAISVFLIDNSDGVMLKVLGTFVSLAFAIISLPINEVLKRAIRTQSFN